MIIGIGHDLCDQRRIRAVYEQFGGRFIRRILSQAEIQEWRQRKESIAYLAGRFALKEAVYKALSSADQTGMSWLHASTLSNPSGAPELVLSGACFDAAQSLLPPNHALHIHLSISDEPPYSSAFVVLSAGLKM